MEVISGDCSPKSVQHLNFLAGALKQQSGAAKEWLRLTLTGHHHRFVARFQTAFAPKIEPGSVRLGLQGMYFIWRRLRRQAAFFASLRALLAALSSALCITCVICNGYD